MAGVECTHRAIIARPIYGLHCTNKRHFISVPALKLHPQKTWDTSRVSEKSQTSDECLKKGFPIELIHVLCVATVGVLVGTVV